MKKELATAVTIVQLNKRQFLIPTAVLRKHCLALRETLPETDETMTHLILNGISDAAFEVFADYFRTGREPDLNIQNVVDVYCAANDLGIAPLKTKCWERVFENLRREDQALILFVEFGRTSVSPENIHKLMTVIAMNFRNIVNTDSFLQLTARQVTQLLSHRPIREGHGIDALFKAGMRWLHADCRGRIAYAGLILKALGDLSGVTIANDLPICPTIARAAEMDIFKVAPVTFDPPAGKSSALPNIGGGSVPPSGMDVSTPPSLESPRNSSKNRSKRARKKSRKGRAVLEPVFSRITVRRMKYDKMMESEETESSNANGLNCMALLPKFASTKAQYVQTSLTSRTARNLPADRTDSSLLSKKRTRTKSVRGSHKYDLHLGSKRGSKSSKKRSKSSRKKQSSKSRRNYRLKSASSGSTRAEREPASRRPQGKSLEKQHSQDEESTPKEISGAPVPRKAKTFPPLQSEPDTTSGTAKDDRSPIILLSSRPDRANASPASPTSYIRAADEFMRFAHDDPDEGTAQSRSSRPSQEPDMVSDAANVDLSRCEKDGSRGKSDTKPQSAALAGAPRGSIPPGKQNSGNNPPNERTSHGKERGTKAGSASRSTFETKNPPVSPVEEQARPCPEVGAKKAAGGRLSAGVRRLRNEQLAMMSSVLPTATPSMMTPSLSGPRRGKN